MWPVFGESGCCKLEEKRDEDELGSHLKLLLILCRTDRGYLSLCGVNIYNVENGLNDFYSQLIFVLCY